MPDVTPEDRLHRLAHSLAAQARAWSTFHPCRIDLDRAAAGTRGFLITFKAIEGEFAWMESGLDH